MDTHTTVAFEGSISLTHVHAHSHSLLLLEACWNDSNTCKCVWRYVWFITAIILSESVISCPHKECVSFCLQKKQEQTWPSQRRGSEIGNS